LDEIRLCEGQPLFYEPQFAKAREQMRACLPDTLHGMIRQVSNQLSDFVGPGSSLVWVADLNISGITSGLLELAAKLGTGREILDEEGSKSLCDLCHSSANTSIQVQELI